MSTPKAAGASLLGLANAKDKTLDVALGGGPDMRSALRGYFRPLWLVQVTKVFVDREETDVETPLRTLGVVVGMKPEELALKPEGLRSWEWKTIFALPDLELATADVVVHQRQRLTVMSKMENAEYGYVRYDCIAGYTPAPRV